MALTLSVAQAFLSQRLGEYAGLVNLMDLLGTGYRSLGLEADDIATLTDVDMARVTSAHLDQLLDVAESRGLDRILQSLDPLALRRIGIEEDPALIEKRLRPIAERLSLKIQKIYGVGLQPITGGILTYDFAQRGDETCIDGGF